MSIRMALTNCSYNQLIFSRSDFEMKKSEFSNHHNWLIRSRAKDQLDTQLTTISVNIKRNKLFYMLYNVFIQYGSLSMFSTVPYICKHVCSSVFISQIRVYVECQVSLTVLLKYSVNQQDG